MKFNRYFDDFDEEFTSPQNRQAHYTKHIKDAKEYNMSEEEYEKAAEELAKTPCDYKRIYGYIAEDSQGRRTYVKYDKDTELFTTYTYRGNTPYTITAFRRSWRDFYGKMYSDENYPYVDEIPKGK